MNNKLYFKNYLFDDLHEADYQLELWCKSNGWLKEDGYYTDKNRLAKIITEGDNHGRFMQYKGSNSKEFFKLKAKLKTEKVILEGWLND